VILTKRLMLWVPLMLVLWMSLFAGCIFGPEKSKEKTTPASAQIWKPLTEAENVIYDLIYSYNRADTNSYKALLHADYTFCRQAHEVLPGEEACWTRLEDEKIVARLFRAARGQYSEDPAKNLKRLTLEVAPSPWASLAEIGGAPCEDCWTTTREYFMTAEMGDKTFQASDLMEFIVVPVDEGGKKLYKLWRATDIAK
jgi:hypothetical protein